MEPDMNNVGFMFFFCFLINKNNDGKPTYAEWFVAYAVAALNVVIFAVFVGGTIR